MEHTRRRAGRIGPVHNESMTRPPTERRNLTQRAQRSTPDCRWNDMNQPRLPRRVLLTAVAVIGVITLLSGCMNKYQAAGLRVLNADRTSHHVAALPYNEQLKNKAAAWASHMASTGTLSHSTLSSGVPSCWRGLGENVGYGSSVRQVEAAFMASSAHRSNILTASYDYVGVGVKWKGSRVWVVQVFLDGCT
jgi:uncharacterized protein YkwD